VNDEECAQEKTRAAHQPRTNRVAIVRHVCRLQEPNRDALVLCARFIGDTPDYVLNQLIDTTIAKDKEFVAWRTTHPGGTLKTALGRDTVAAPRVVANNGNGERPWPACVSNTDSSSTWH
jgi:hypothetical protein